MEFTYEAYERLIKSIVDNGYQITNYHECTQQKCPCILRHDVDMSIKKAREFAEFESKIKVKSPVCSTYFVLITSDFYNPYSKENVRMLKEILSFGHEIGLHFDEKKYMCETTFEPSILEECVKKEKEILSNMIEFPISVVSMHRPSKKILENDLEFEGLINSYSKIFFQTFRYLSDSRMCWREDVEEIVNRKKEQKLHILTHPFWYTTSKGSTKSVLENFLNASYEERYITMADNFRELEEFIKL